MIQENFVIDSKGRKVAVQVPIRMYKKLLADAEELEEIREYRKAKSYKSDVISFEEAFEEIGTLVEK